MKAAFVLLMGLLALSALGLTAERIAAPAVEARLAAQVGERLREAGLPEHVVSVDGRDVWVDATPQSPELQAQVVEALGPLRGLRAIHTEAATSTVPPRIDARWTGSTLRLTGQLKGEGTDAERSALSDGLRRTLGNATILNEITLDPDVERASWVGDVPRLLRVLWGNVRDGELQVEGLSIMVAGSVVDENTRTEVGERLAALIPGVTIENRITVPGGHEDVRDGIADILARGSVEFEEGTDRLTEPSQVVLNELSGLIASFPDVHVRIEGYFYTGRAHEEFPVSQVRADVVRDYLVAQGVLPSQLTAQGRGSPAYAGVTEDQGVQSLILFLVEEGV